MSTGVIIVLVGMLTVFAILGLVFVSGSVLVTISNNRLNEQDEASISGEELAVVTAAVKIITKGKGRIKDIHKI